MRLTDEDDVEVAEWVNGPLGEFEKSMNLNRAAIAEVFGVFEKHNIGHADFLTHAIVLASYAIGQASSGSERVLLETSVKLLTYLVFPGEADGHQA